MLFTHFESYCKLFNQFESHCKLFNQFESPCIGKEGPMYVRVPLIPSNRLILASSINQSIPCGRNKGVIIILFMTAPYKKKKKKIQANIFQKRLYTICMTLGLILGKTSFDLLNAWNA